MAENYPERIRAALVYDVAVKTPLEPAALLSQRLDNNVLLKREDQQSIFSFKVRGAFNKMSHLSEQQRARGVAAASAGNHAQGVALAARHLGCHALIFMPVTTPRIKVQTVRSLGAEVVLRGDSYDEAYAYAREAAMQSERVFVHPYDDPDIIAGQGTIGKELIEQHEEPIDVIFVPVGGGGLISGIASYVKSVTPDTKIIGVEPDDAAAMKASLEKGERVLLDHVGLFADGVAVAMVGEETFGICRRLVDEIVTVDTDAICAAIKDAFEDTRSILEPAGALSIAGMKHWVERDRVSGKTLVAIASGANMNFDRLRFVAERAELGEQREAILAVTIPERAGSLKEFCRALGTRNITEFNYRYADDREAHVFVGVGMENRSDLTPLMEALSDKHFSVINFSDNEMAKLHIAHMVGGHAAGVPDEVLYRFEFPERPGALMKFLDGMPHDWNISLFHYRNHGTDYGRVLIGMQVPETERAEFRGFLDKIGYEYIEETDNPAYRMFLA